MGTYLLEGEVFRPVADEDLGRECGHVGLLVGVEVWEVARKRGGERRVKKNLGWNNLRMG